VGWVRMRTSGPAGTRITLRFAEALQPDGSIYTRNLRAARQVDEVILTGVGKEVFEPRFTFHGFRYLEIRGAVTPLTVEDVTACVMHNDMPCSGMMETSDPRINKLLDNVRWSQRANFP